MKKELLIFLSLLTAIVSFAQENKDMEGAISHVTSSSVYIKMPSTSLIMPGDTLYVQTNGSLIPRLVVTGKSSLSIVASPIGDYKATISEKVVFKMPSFDDNKLISPESPISEDLTAISSTSDTSDLNALVSKEKQQIKGKIAAATYNTYSNTPSGDFHRFRYTLNIQVKNLGGSKISAETYISFIHKTEYWKRIQENIFNGLKIYNLALIYQVNDKLTLTGGRKINPRLSSMGPVDGIQAEYRLNTLSVGALIGERPNFEDFRFNFIRRDDSVSNYNSLFQYGIYISHEQKLRSGNIQTTLAFVDQKNGGVTDRRFAYLQHSNSLIENLFFFGSAEIDMYKLNNIEIKSSPNFTNLYLSGSYRILKNLSLSLSYSARKNIIYYETYKSFIDRYIEDEMQQGYSGRIHYSPLNSISLGASAGYRKRKDDPEPSRNAYFYATYKQLPFVNAALTISATLLETSYLIGNVYGISANRSYFKNKLNTTVAYRYQDYQYGGSEAKLIQHTPEISFNWYIVKQLSLGLNYEIIVEENYLTHRVFAQVVKRF